jgi:hypothetical protein
MASFSVSQHEVTRNKEYYENTEYLVELHKNNIYIRFMCNDSDHMKQLFRALENCRGITFLTDGD